MSYVGTFTAALRDAGTKIGRASRQLVRTEGEAKSWLSRLIVAELAHRASTRGPAYWDEHYADLTPEQRANARIQRTLTRATVSGVAAATGATATELVSAGTDGAATPIAIPAGLLCVGADLLYTTALQIDLAFDLASIYGVPFAADDVGEIATLLALPLGVGLAHEPEPEVSIESAADRPWRSVDAMYRSDFADSVGTRLVSASVVRDVLPIAGIFVSAIVSQIHLRRFAHQVHAAMRHRVAIASACRRAGIEDEGVARTIVEGAWLMASACGRVEPEEALAISMLIDTLPLPERTPVDETRFRDDEDGWLADACALGKKEKDALLEVLALVATSNGELDDVERRFLRRVARAFGRELDFFALERYCARLRDGEVAGAGNGSTRLPFELAPSRA